MKRFTVDLPEDVHKRLKIHCAEIETDMTELVRQLIVDYLERAEKKKKT